MAKRETREEIKKLENFKIASGIFDERTLLNLYELLNSSVLDTVESVVKSGKESVVLAGLKSKRWYAIKVYRTFACDYKSMWRYLVSDPRVRGLSKRRWVVVKLWSRKEFKNLKLARKAGVDCPEPIALKENVLVMEFIGKDGLPAPRLVDVEIPNPRKTYRNMLKNMEKLAKAGIVHGDLSAYNVLYYKKPVIIDFSQSIPLQHPFALELLKRDIRNVNNFFKKRGVDVEDEKKIYERLVEIIEASKDAILRKATKGKG